MKWLWRHFWESCYCLGSNNTFNIILVVTIFIQVVSCYNCFLSSKVSLPQVKKLMRKKTAILFIFQAFENVFVNDENYKKTLSTRGRFHQHFMQAAFMHPDSKSRKNSVNPSVFFALLCVRSKNTWRFFGCIKTLFLPHLTWHFSQLHSFFKAFCDKILIENDVSYDDTVGTLNIGFTKVLFKSLIRFFVLFR